MNITVSELRANLLEVLRLVESGRESVEIERAGKVIARLTPPTGPGEQVPKPWERLRGTGELRAKPGESVIHDEDFDASR